jgi:hypothetical protein
VEVVELVEEPLQMVVEEKHLLVEVVRLILVEVPVENHLMLEEQEMVALE